MPVRTFLHFPRNQLSAKRSVLAVALHPPSYPAALAVPFGIAQLAAPSKLNDTYFDTPVRHSDCQRLPARALLH